ncbi:MAG: OmpA family protein [Deltaproteobacteria bacterium]|nr:OmpA family protein [Deltaproteobacteria bacterium]
MAASLVAGVADLGLLNLSLIPRALAGEEPSLPTPATSADPKHPSPDKGAEAPGTGTVVEAVAAGAESKANVATIDDRGVAVPATPPAAEPPPVEVPAAVASSSTQGDASGRAEGEVSGGANQAGAAAASEAGPSTNTPPPPAGEAEIVILFSTGDNNLTPEARAELRSFAATVAEDASAFVIVEGHADERGRNLVNRELAAARAATVAARLTSLAVPRARIKVDSFGEDRPVAEGRSEEALQKNRCVVVRVTRGRP